MHICATDARQASDRYPNNGLISVRASSTEWEHRAAEVGGVKEERGGGRREEGEGSRRQGICDAQRLASQPASQRDINDDHVLSH